MANYSMDNEYLNNSNTNTLQQQDDGTLEFVLSILLISILIIVLFSCLEKWAGNKPGQRGCCKSRIFPVDLMNTSEARFGYAAAFGSTASSLLGLFLKIGNTSGIPIWSNSLVYLGLALIVGLVYYPLFACLTTDWIFLGSIVGFFYSGAWFVFTLQQAINNPDQIDAIFITLPETVCLFVLIIIYAYRSTNHAISVWRNSNVNLMLKEKSGRLAANFNAVYVRQLFKKTEKRNEDEMEKTAGVVNILKQKISGWMYKQDPTFKYSTRILSVVTVSSICAYQLGTIFLINAAGLIKANILLRNFADSGKPTNLIATVAVKYRAFLLVLFDVLSASIIIAFVLASLLTVYSISQILVNYRTNLKEMFKGSYRHLPFNPENRDAHVILSDSLDYAGSHIAFILWGYIIVFLALFIVGLLVAGCIVLPLTGQLPMSILIYELNFIPPILMVPILRITKKAFCKWKLLETKASIDQHGEESVKSVLALKNRNCYHNLSYFSFFFYIVLGVIGCMLTIIKSIVLGVYYLARLDRCSLCKGFEKWDRGYMVYLSFLYVESSHRHPVVLVFCDALYEDLKAGRNDVLMTPVIEDRLTAMEESNTGSGILRVTSINFSPKRKWIRNRWLKAYTLLRNPSLVPTEEYM